MLQPYKVSVLQISNYMGIFPGAAAVLVLIMTVQHDVHAEHVAKSPYLVISC